jgi:two-component system, NarL family, sensor histidine kinase DesK
MSRQPPLAPEDYRDRMRELRRVLVIIVILIAIGGQAVRLLQAPLTGPTWFQLIAAIVFVGLTLRQFTVPWSTASRPPWLVLAIILALGIALVVAGGRSSGWVPALAIAGAAWGRYSRSPVPAVAASVICAAAGLTVAVRYHYGSGNVFSAALIGPLAALLAYSAGRRADALDSLRRTRAELARAAVTEERLRIARDLHDLLGHSLSLITLKAELARRLMTADPDRAGLEIAELESVARQSLSDVREAVAGFRQPDLTGELAAARQLLDAAGIASQITAADTDQLARDVDSALAWAVREGTTNVVRHSRATQVTIRVTAGPATAVAEIADNGPAAEEIAPGGGPGVLTAGPDGRAATPQARPAFAGSGLAGLAERVRSLGGELAAGSVEPHGFRLRVVVPLTPQA